MQGLTALQECSIKTETNGIILWNAQMGGDSQFHSKKLKNEYISMGVMQETKEIIMAIANLTIFFSCWSRWFWRQDNCSTFLVLFSYCPCDNAIHDNQGKKGNEGEVYKRCRNKSLVCFLVVGCRSLFQITIHLILVRDQFETVEIRCVEGDGDKPRV